VRAHTTGQDRAGTEAEVERQDLAWRLEMAGEPGRTLVRVAGDLDLETAPKFLAAVGPDLDTGTGGLVVDLSRVTFIDSSGLSALIRVNQRMSAAGRELSIIAPGPSAAKIFEITGLDQVLPLRAGPA
jgi:anti-anti-sigma factor